MKVPSRRVHLVVSWVLVTLYAELIFALSDMQRLPFGIELKYHSDKLVHGVEYSILGLLVARALHLTFRFRSWKRLILLSVVLSGLYALSDEYHQSFVPDREVSTVDATADTLGAWAGAWAWVRYKHRKKSLFEYEDA